MLIRFASIAIFGALVAVTATSAAQQAPPPTDSASRVEIRNVLRTFYFNRAHGNTNSLLIDMLGSKIDANRNAPFEAIVASDTLAHDTAISCPPSTPAPVDSAVIVLKGNWAHVSVPRCGSTESAADQFRMIRLEERWRFVDFRVFDSRR